MPEQAFIISANDEIVPARVDIKATNPPRPRLKRLDEFLFREIVQPDIALCSHEQVWAERVKFDALNDTAGFSEGGLRIMFRDLVD